MTIKLNEYKISPDSYLKVVNKSVVGDYWITPTTIYVILLGLSFYDIRYLILMIMLTVLLVPLYIAYLFVWHGMKPESRYSIINKSVLINDEGLDIDFGEAHKPIKIAWEEFQCFHPTQSDLILHFRKSKYLYFIIPYSSTISKEQLDSLFEIIKSHLALSSDADIDEDGEQNNEE